MGQGQGRTKYYMTSEFQDVIQASKFAQKATPILGGVSKDAKPARKLLDSAKTMFDYESAYDVSREFDKPDKRDHEVNQRWRRFESNGHSGPGSGPRPIDLQVVSAGLQGPDPDQGIDERVVLTNDPQLRKLITQLGGKAMSIEEFGKQAREQGLIGKDESDLLKRSTSEQNKQRAKRGGFDVDGVVENEKENLSPEQREKIEENNRAREVEKAEGQAKQMDKQVGKQKLGLRTRIGNWFKKTFSRKPKGPSQDL